MKLLDRLERRLGRFAVPNVTLVIIFGQIVFFVGRHAELHGAIQRPIVERLTLIPSLVLQGEVWRLVTFVFDPPGFSLLWAALFWYFFYFIGSVMEQTWGTFRYNVYLLVGYLATVAASFLAPDVPASIAFLQGSVFLAFAYLYPDFVIHVMFVFPIRVRWLALIAWAGCCLVFLSGNLVAIAMTSASVVNFFVFFGKDVFLRVIHGHRSMKQQASRITERKKPRHVCVVCGITNLTHPGMDFRYCSKCRGQQCYCEEHLRNHEHVDESVDSQTTS
ncbi:MAG TPA: hypothetical protein DD670_10315 [Planctomycetaceae bacterium]|nr:hypothetical protein [Planctomycetaceae bacterium]